MRTLEPGTPTAPTCAPATVTVREARLLLGISRDLAYKAVRVGDLPSLRMGERLLVPAAKLRKMLGLTDDEFAARLDDIAKGA